MRTFTLSLPIVAALLAMQAVAIEEVKKDAPATAEPNAANALTLDLGGGVTMELVPIKPGTFDMGSPEGEKDRHPNEKQHSVTISSAFFMSKYPVTQQQYEAVMKTNPSEFSAEKGGGPNYPVEQISWHDAVAFCEKLDAAVKSKLPPGMTLQLPTEAQWEYACRAGTKTRFYSGDAPDDLARAGWYGKNSDDKPHPVGQKVANAFGLYDMHGDVYQWCQDVYMLDYEKLSATDPCNTAPDLYRVMRGGAWRSVARNCRAAYRHDVTPGYRGGFVGIRVVASKAR